MHFSFETFQEQIPDWKQRLDYIVETMKDLSRQTDPEAMVREYTQRLRRILPVDRYLSLSRRGHVYPEFRVTRDSLRTDDINPWRDKHLQPLLRGGVLAELLYDDEPRVINDLEYGPDDPCVPYLQGMRSIMIIPHYDQGVALNAAILMRKEPNAFQPESLPEQVWLSNLFGRVTYNLVLNEELNRAKKAIEEELRVVADIQRSLLPAALPQIPRLGLAARYQTSRIAGGDYYDIFSLPGGQWGLLIADVSGHGTPSAVIMAITHALAHSYNGSPIPPSRLLGYVNRHLARRYTADNGSFVTAFYGIFDPATLTFEYSSAGHNPPRLKRCSDGRVLSLDQARGLPLGIFEDHDYTQARLQLVPDDQIIFYTDGIIEAVNREGVAYGVERLDRVISLCQLNADDIITALLSDLERFTDGLPADDDRTLLVAKVG